MEQVPINLPKAKGTIDGRPVEVVSQHYGLPKVKFLDTDEERPLAADDVLTLPPATVNVTGVVRMFSKK